MRIFDKSYSIVGFVLRIIGILIVLGLLIWGIASFIGLFTDDASAPAPNKTGSSSQQDESGTTISQPSQSTSKSTSGSSTSASGKSTSGGQTSSTSTQIPNSGPGDVFAIFLLATATGYVGYQISLRKRIES